MLSCDGCGVVGGGLVLEGQAVLGRGEDVLDGAVAVGAQALGARAGGLEPLVAVAPAEAHEPQAGAVALLGVRAALEDLGHHAPRGRSGLLGPADEARGRPLRVRPVRAGHVLGQGRGLAVVASTVRRHPPAFVEDLDDRGGVARLDLLVDELVRDAVEMPLDLDVVVDVDPAGLPLAPARSGRRAAA